MNSKHLSALFSLSLSLFFYSPTGLSQFLLTESELVKMAKLENPRLQQIKAQLEGSSAAQSATQSQYDPKLSASYSYASSKENAIIQFVPVFQPQKLLNVGLSQKTSVGTTFKTNVFAQQISTGDGFIDNATQVGVQLGVEIDIWKNFLGSLDRSQLQSKKISRQVSKLQSDIETQNFILDVRKVYWSLIANELSLDLSKQLVTTAKKQLSDSKRKVREGLGDSGDVARNQAQYQSRESSVLFFSYQKELLLANLRSLIPSLKNKTLSLNGREALDVEVKTRQCMAQITAQTQLNNDHSRFDEIVGLLDQQEKLEVKLADATDSIDVKLQAQYQASGVSNSHSEAYNRLTDDFRNGYQVGVALQIPLGGDISKARKSQVNAAHYKIDSQKQALSLQLHAEHQKIQRAVNLLAQASRSQGATIESLKKSLKKTKRKYKQARVSLNTYILEQDNLFNSELQLINTKKQILHLLLDYFKVFSKHPCQINSVYGVQS